MFSWIRPYLAEVCALPSALLAAYVINRLLSLQHSDICSHCSTSFSLLKQPSTDLSKLNEKKWGEKYIWGFVAGKSSDTVC